MKPSATSSAISSALRGAKPERALDALVRATGGWPAAGQSLLLACSGGPDSVGLASILDRLAREAGFELVLGHVNHGLRESAEQDECVVLAVGARLGRPVAIRRAAPGRADEATLRAARYAALDAIATETGARALATAHTAQDQTETVLLALFRGTGLAGLAGMAPISALPGGLPLLRPLLRAGRAEVGLELQRSGLPYALDPTNADRRYRRNAVRAALAELRTDFPHLDRSVARCAHIVRAELAGDERTVSRRLLRANLRAQGELRDVSFERIEAVLDARPGRRVFVKTGVELKTGDAYERH